jgi:hypothetical protein
MLKRFFLSLITFMPIFVGLGLIFAGKGPIERCITSFSFFISGFTGVIIIIRKEIPIPMGSIEGGRAVIEGLLLTIVLWSISLYIILFGF